jgi:predicted nucleotidyltransferase
MQLPQPYREIVDRIAMACRSGNGVVAAFIQGSFADGTADAYSDLDLGLVTSGEGHDAFYADRGVYVRLLGEPLFLEDFDSATLRFAHLSDGAEVEIAIGRESQLESVDGGPYKLLLDKKGIGKGRLLPRHVADRAEQVEALRRLIIWFWHDLSHVITALARGQLWWAYGQLEELRRYCVALARLEKDFSTAEGWE